MPFVDILENGIIKFKNYYTIIIKVYSINFNLKSNLEKENILNSYKNFLKICNFNIQIIIQSQKEDLLDHLSEIEKIKINEEKKIKEITDKYIEDIKRLNEKNKSNSKQFYILIKESNSNKNKDICKEELMDKYFKIKDSLERCGNKVQLVSDVEEIKEILRRNFYIKS